MAKAADWMIGTSGAARLPLDLPVGVELSARSNGDRTVWILINFAGKTAEVNLPAEMADVLNGGKVKSVQLDQYGVAVLSR